MITAIVIKLLNTLDKTEELPIIYFMCGMSFFLSIAEDLALLNLLWRVGR